MKTKVKMLKSCEEWEEGDIGYIDGYVSTNEFVINCVVVIKNKIVWCKFWDLEVINEGGV